MTSPNGNGNIKIRNPSNSTMVKFSSQTLLLVTCTAMISWMLSTLFCQSNYSELFLHNVEQYMSPLQKETSVYSSGQSTKSLQQGQTALSVPDTTSTDATAASKPKIDDKFAKPKKMWVTLPDETYQGPSRVWPIWNNGTEPFPCVYPGADERKLMITKPAHQGLLFQRPEKTGTTTMVGIVMRLAHNRAAQRNGYAVDSPQAIAATNQSEPHDSPQRFKFCRHRAMHGTAVEMEYHKRDKKKSFLFSVIRDPTAKAVSRFFHFSVSVYQHVPSDMNFQNNLRGKDYSRFHLRDLSTNPHLNWTQSTGPRHVDFILPKMDYHQVVQEILDDYDFIAITERMDESLVVMKILLNLTMDEIVYSKPARSAGSFSNGPEGRPCVYLIPSFLTPGMTRYLESSEWRTRIEGDELLYQAAYRSLDRTIEALGRDRVERTLAQFRKAQAYAQSRCEGKVVGMCNEEGRAIPKDNRTCYIWAEGCDYQCLNSMTFPPELIKEVG